MKDRNLAPRYAEALLDVAEKVGAVDAILGDVHQLVPMVRAQPRLLMFLNLPQIPAADKKRLLRRTFDGRVHPILLNLLLLLVDRQRADYLPEICEAFEIALDRRRLVHPVEVRTAVPFPEDLRPLLIGKLEIFCQGRVRIHYVVDPDILGGVMVIRKDTGTFVDGTLRRSLDRLREGLLKTRVH
jgi:F-type H+-transporting ATPase subunit delta